MILIKPQPEPTIEPTCQNCRNQNTKLCLEYKRKKRYYSTHIGYKNTKHEKDHCKWWAYKPEGVW
ncbi:MAG: hypothetical protein IBV52_01530 [Candidatus Bathyarchaeota archaeon]